MQVQQREEMAEVEDDGAIIEDEEYDEVDIESDEDDDDWDGDEDDEGQDELYESPLDKVNEVIFFHEKMAGLETTHKQLYDYLCSQIDEEANATLSSTLQKTQYYMQQQH